LLHRKSTVTRRTGARGPDGRAHVAENLVGQLLVVDGAREAFAAAGRS